MPIDKAPQTTYRKNIHLREDSGDDSSIEKSSETHKFQDFTVTNVEPKTSLSIKEQTKKNAELLAKVYIPMSELSKKAIKGIKRAILTMDRERMFPEKVVIGRMDDTPKMDLKKDTLIQVTKGAIPALTVKTKNIATQYDGAKLDIPENLQEYFVFDSRNPVGIKDICLFGTADDLQAYLEKRDNVGVFSKIPEDERTEEIANVQKKYPIYAGIFSEYQKNQEVKVWNPRRAIILKAIKVHAFVVAGLIAGGIAGPIDPHVKLPITVAKTLRVSNRLRKFLDVAVKKVKHLPINLTKGAVNFVADGVDFVADRASKDKKAKLPKLTKPNIFKTKAEKLQDKIDKALAKEEQEKNKVLMLRISYMPLDGLVPIGEKEISLQDIGKKLGMIQKSEIISTEGETSNTAEADTVNDFDESVYSESDSEFDFEPDSELYEIIEEYKEYIHLADANARFQG